MGVGVEEKLGGLHFFLDGIWGALKCQKMTLGGSSSFSSFVLYKVLYCVILKQFHQHFDKKI